MNINEGILNIWKDYLISKNISESVDIITLQIRLLLHPQVCRTAPIVQRSDLSDLLIAPMQHQCHYQLLLDVSHYII